MSEGDALSLPSEPIAARPEGEIVIARRFRGPPESGNGGYVCGRLARFLGGSAAAVRLRVPPPLEKRLTVRRSEPGVALYDGDILVAEARSAPLEIEAPAPPSHEQARAAAQRFRGFATHWFPLCFVCGPERGAGDGLRIFSGPLGARGLVACPWTPDASLGLPGGSVAPEFLWAALDCPGAFAFPPPAAGAILLGELAVALSGEVSVGEPCVLIAWELARQGRKHFTGTALFGAAGDLRGLARAPGSRFPEAMPRPAPAADTRFPGASPPSHHRKSPCRLRSRPPCSSSSRTRS